MVEREVRGGDVGEVRRDVPVGDLDLAVLHVLGVDEQDVVEHVELLQQSCAHEPVEVAAGDEAVLLLRGLPTELDHVFAFGRGRGELERATDSVGWIPQRAGSPLPRRRPRLLPLGRWPSCATSTPTCGLARVPTTR